MGKFGPEGGSDQFARLFEESQRTLKQARYGQPTDDELVGHLRIDATDPAQIQAVAEIIRNAASHFPSHGPDEPPAAHEMPSQNIPPTPGLSAGAAAKEPVAPKAPQPLPRPRKI